MTSLFTMAFVVHAFQISRNASAFVREAKRAQADKRPREAIEHMRRYVKLAPDDPEGLLLFGTLLASVDRNEAALLTLSQALQKWPDRMDIRRKFVEVSMNLGRFADATDQLKGSLIPASPEDGGLFELLSRCQIGQSLYQEAEKTLETAIETAPDQLDCYLMLAVLRQSKLNRPGDAIEPVNQMVDNNPGNHLSYFKRIQWLLQRISEIRSSLKVSRRTNLADVNALLDQARQDVDQMLKLAPNYGDGILLAIQVAHNCGQDDDALKLARHGVEVEPDESRFYSVLAELEVGANNPDGAVEVLRRGTVAAKNSSQLKWLLADTLIGKREFSDATTIIEQLRLARYPEAMVNFLEGELEVNRAEWLEAIRLFNAARPGMRDQPNLVKRLDYWLGISYREIKSTEQSLICFRRSISIDPDWIPPRLALADSLLQAGSAREAISEYRLATSKPGNSIATMLELARSQLIANLQTKAELRNWSDFDDTLTTIEKSEQVPVKVAMLRMEKLIANDQLEAAGKVISEAREAYPDEMELWSAQMALLQIDKNWDRLEELLQDASKIFGDTVDLRILKGRYLIQRYENEAVGQLRLLSIPATDWKENDRIQLATAFAPIFLAVKEFDDSQNLALEVARAEPKNLNVRLLLLDLASRAKRPELMESVLEEIRGITGEGAIWNYAKAFLLTVMARDDAIGDSLDDAIPYLKKSRILAPNWERVPLLLAEVYEAKGMRKTACDQYLESIQLGERRTSIVSRVLTLLFFDRRFEDAEKLIRMLHESQSSFTEEMARAEVDLSLQLGRREDALRTAEQLVSKSDEAQDPVWLGDVFIALEKPAEATRQFRRAIQIHPEAAEPRIGLVRSLKLSGLVDQAEIAIDEGLSSVSPDESVLTAAKCYEILGKLNLARDNFRSAVDRSPSDLTKHQELASFFLRTSDTVNAVATLRKMIELASGSDEPTIAVRMWARRNLVPLLVAVGDSTKLTESMKIIEQNLAELTQPSIEDLRLKALILASGASDTERRQSIGILEKLLSENPSSASALEDRFLLAQLYLQTGDRSKSRSELRKLISVQKDNPQYLNAYALLSLQAGETSEAELYVNLLKKLAPNEISTFDLQAKLLYAKGRYAELVKVLKGIGDVGIKDLKQSESNAKSRLWAAQQLEEYARLLMTNGKNDDSNTFVEAAEYCFGKFVLERPNEMLVLAEFLAQTNQIDRALNLLQEHAPASPPARVANVAIRIMRNAGATKPQLARLQEVLNDNIETLGKPLVLELTSAELLSWRGEYREAINAYRKLLARFEESLALRNNLAILLSMTMNEHKEALELLEKAIEIHGPVADLLDSRGIVYLGAGDTKKALTEFYEVIKQNDSAEAHFHLALALAELKQFNDAQVSLDRADTRSISAQTLHPLDRSRLKTLRLQLKQYATSASTQQPMQ